jgi:hypothetical protein
MMKTGFLDIDEDTTFSAAVAGAVNQDTPKQSAA